MTGQLLTHCNKDASEFGKSMLTFSHTVHERPMFTDDGLADLLDTYPRDKLGIYTMGDDPVRYGTFRKGSAGDMPGRELLEAAKTGRFWLNLRAANCEVDDYQDLCDDMFGALENWVPGLRTFKRDVGVLISSPKAQVFYHLDIPMVTLWQIRGVKRVRLYPATAPYVTDDDLERVVLRETEEEFDFDPAFDNGADMIDLQPGQMISWPQTAPHRINNHDMLNVSLSCEFMTLPAVIHANALYANGIIRRSFGGSPQIERDGVMTSYAKAGLARIFKALNSRKVFERHMPVTFNVDPDVEGGIRDVAAVA